jgi:2-keto-4-pentenoate hydratase/2-oxohepta-3-ene-1,7-dioic acid hydratase in catechol pathway
MVIQLVSFDTAEGRKTGMLHDGKVYASGRFAGMLDVLDQWDSANAKLAELGDVLPQRTPVPAATLAAPLVPRNIYFAGANYKDHVAEMKKRLGLPLEANPKELGHKPWFCMKATGATVVGPGAAVARPQGSPMLDWELELAVVIGQRCSDVPLDRAYEVIAGYTIANDLSARENVGRDGVANDSPFKWDWIGQKTFDGSCPLGPAITPHRFIGDPMDLDMKLWVNGELMQDSNTGQMIFDIADQVSHLSSRVTLMPGDVILTGTPAGVGMARNRFLQPGDTVRHWIENIGEFEISIR